jgi:Rrf2 family iron-sulfur cluster assembly transcriptional regulator
MNLLSRRSVLAVAAVVDVALHSRSAPVVAKALAARHKLPPRHLETLLQGLGHAKILKGVRGPRGGYELARERRRITVGEIVRIAMSLSTADPDDLGSNSVLIERTIDPAVRRAGETFFSPTSTRSRSNRCARPLRRPTCSTTRRSTALSPSDRLRSSALIHRAALQPLELPAGIIPPGFDASRPRRRCEHRFACARAAPGLAQGRPSRFQDGQRLR